MQAPLQSGFGTRDKIISRFFGRPIISQPKSKGERKQKSFVDKLQYVEAGRKAYLVVEQGFLQG